MKKYNINFLKYSIFFIFIFILVYLVFYFYFYNRSYSKSKGNFTNSNEFGNKTFKSSCKYADVEFNTSNNGETLYITVNYKDLTGVSAIHIHTNNNGSPGPVLAWLGTSNEWQHGVAQNTPGSNAPCCTDDNPLCVLSAPDGTPYINTLSNSTQTFTVTNRTCKQCPWITNGTFLDVHGFNFQKVLNGKLTSEKPGADIISNTPFTMVN